MTTIRARRTREMKAHLAAAERLEAEASELLNAAREDAAHFPAGPGSIRPRGRDRYHRDQHRADERAYDLTRMARHQRAIAAGIQGALQETIWDDDPDALERLTERLQAAEARRTIARADLAAREQAGDMDRVGYARMAVDAAASEVARTRRRIRKLGGTP